MHDNINTDNISFVEAESNEETATVWLVALVKFGQKLGLFEDFKEFKLKMKKVEYTVHQKLMVIMMSIMIGCKTTKDINEKLGIEKLVLSMFGMERCPDQSQINEVIRRFDERSIEQLEEIHEKQFIENSKSLETREKIVIDVDQTGLIENGQNYELAEKGYFSKKKNQKGYQMLAAYTGKETETIAMTLDSGNTHCTEHHEDMVKKIVKMYEEKIDNEEVIIRTDSGFGTGKIIEMMEGIPKIKFITKTYSSVEAKKIGEKIEYKEYEKAGNRAWVYEIEDEGSELRHIIVKVLTKKMTYEYTMLITNISKAEKRAVELFKFYNERQTIEAFFKMTKNVYHIKNLRTKKFYGIYGFLWIVFITHNIISLFKETMLGGTELGKEGMKVLVEKVGQIQGFVKRLKEVIQIRIPKMTKLRKLILEAICNETPIAT